MRENNYPLLLLPLAAVLAFIYPLSSHLLSPPAPPEGRAQASTETGGANTAPATVSGGATASEAIGNAARMIHHFFGITPPSPPPGEGSECGHSLLAEYEMEFLIATIPDPKESRLNYLFDRNLEAIQRAIEASDYVLDRFDLPWLDENGNAKGAAGRKRHLDEPGVILFRSKGGSPSPEPPRESLLVLLLVGETPTYGIHKKALANALDQVALLSGWRRDGSRPACMPAVKEMALKEVVYCGDQTPETAPRTSIRLLAPTFSGSQDSLVIALRNWLDAFAAKYDEAHRPALRLISGSATAVDQREFCQRLGSPPQPKFQATVLPTQPALARYRRYLLERDPAAQSGKIALLTEANTTYGSKLLADESEGRQVPGWPLSLPFPLHISQLRSATERARSTRSQSAPETPGSRRLLLPPLLEDAMETNEVVPLFSQFEKASLELALSNLLAEINREHIRHVGIIATDVRDCIFLTREIRRHCPNAEVFILFADLIYLHPELNADLRGALVITPYSLFNPNQFWISSFEGQGSRLLFPSFVAQGAYNAALALLGKTERMQEYGYPFDLKMAPPDPGKPKPDQRRPALWVSIVGENNLWPVKLFDDWDLEGSYRDYVFRTAGVPKPERLHVSLSGGPNSKTTITVLLLSAGLGLLVGAILFVEWVRNSITRRRWRRTETARRLWQRLRRGPGETFGDAVFVGYRFWIRLYLLGCCLSLLFIHVPVLLVSLLPWWVQREIDMQADWESSFAWVMIASGSVVALLIAPLIWLFSSLIDWSLWIAFPPPPAGPNKAAPAPRPRHRLAINLSAAALTALVFLIAALVGRSMLTDRPAEEHLFYFLRASDLTNDVSPLVPLLLVGVAGLACASCSLRRMKLLERLHSRSHPRLPHLNFDDGERSSFAGVGQYETSVVGLLSSRFWRLPVWYLVTGLVLIPYANLLYLRFVPTIEGHYFDLFFRGGFVLVSLFLALAFLRFCHVWIALRHLLRRLSLHPLFAFRVSGKEQGERFPGMPQLNLTSSSPNYLPLVYSVRQGVELRRQPEAGDDLCAPLLAAERHLELALGAKARGEWRRALKHRCTAQVALARASRLLARRLDRHWSAGHTAATEEREHAVPDPLVARGELFLASRIASFLHLILAHMQNLVVFVTSGMILLLMAISYYPFQPHDRMLLFGWILILSVVAVTIWIFVQMDRDSVLSLFTGSTPGKVELNRSFISRILIHGLLPVLALLNAQFPDAIRQVFSWVDVFRNGVR